MTAARDEAQEWVRAKGLEPGKELQWLSDISNKYIWKGERGNYDANVLQLSVACSRASDGGEEGEGEEGSETGKGEFALDVEAALIEIFSLAWIKTTFMPAKSDGGEIGGEIGGEDEGSDRESVQDAIVRAIKRCEEGGVIQRESLLIYMEKDLLAKCGYVKSAQQLFVKERKINTKLNFKQNKYNLLGEESEGYAKCIIALNTYGAAPGGAQADLRRHIESLIGRFSLDPNRVLEVILGILEEFPSADNLWGLIPIFNTEALVHVLGFKFQGYHAAKTLAQEEAQEEGEVPTTPGERAANGAASGGPAVNAPSALYALVGNLMKRELVTCEALLGHLSPPNQAVREAHARARDLVTKDVDDIGKISLNSKDPKAKTQKQGQGASVLNARRMALDASEMYAEVVSHRIDGYSFHGQRMRLCIAALESQNWDLALVLLDYWKGIGVLPATDKAIAQAMCTAVSVLLEPAWSRLFPQGMVRAFAKGAIATKDLSTGQKVEEIFLCRHVKALATHLGENLCTNPKLLTKVCRYLGGALVVLRERDQAPKKDAKGSYASMERYAVEIMEAAILPALCLIPANPAITMEVWHVLDMLPYTARFLLYGKWQQKIGEAHLLRAASKMAHVEVRRILRRVTTASSGSAKGEPTAVSLKDITKALSGEGADKQSDLASGSQREREEEREKKVQLGRMLAKCCHACPLACLEVIVKQVESYGEKMALPIVDSLRFLTPFGLDVLTFIILCRLASASKDKYKEDGVNIADWVEALAVFLGLLCKNYHNKGISLSALCQYVTNQLKVNEVVDLVVIRQMVAHAAGIDHVGDISDNQVEMLAGGDMLQISGMLKSDQTPQMRRASAALRACLNLARDARRKEDKEEGDGDGDLGIPLLILMAQQHNALMFTLLNPPLKLMGNLIDRSQASFLQYSSFLQEEITRCSARYSGGALIGCHPADIAKYADLLPKMSEMASLYKLEPEYVFHVHRPVMRYLFLQSHEDVLREAGEGDMDPQGAQDQQGVKEGDGSGGPEGAMAPSWAALLEEIGANIRTPAGLNMDLYATFWSLGLGDLFFPKQRYADAQETLQAQVKQIDKAVAKMDRDIGSAREHKLYIEGDLARSTRSRGNRQARDNKNSRESRTWEKKLKELNDLEEELVQMQKQREDLGQIKAKAKMMVNKTRAEMLACAQQAQDAKKCLDDATDRRWSQGQSDFDMGAFFHHCVLPRMRLSESDALFCGVFLNDFASKLCASAEGSKGAGRAECWSFVRSEISKLIGLLTAAEAVRLGIFLSCSVSPPSGAPSGPTGGSQPQGQGSLWPLLIKKLEEEGEYMTRKNAMVVLRRCVGKGLAQEEAFIAAKTKLLEVLAKIGEAAVEEDLKQMAKSLTGFIVGKVKKPASAKKPSAQAQNGPGPQAKAKGSRPSDLLSPREHSRGPGGRGRVGARLDARSPPFVPASHQQGRDRRDLAGRGERDRRGAGAQGRAGNLGPGSRDPQDRNHHNRGDGRGGHGDRSRTDRQERKGKGGGTYSHPNCAAKAGEFGKSKTPDGRGDRDRDRDRDSDRGIKRRMSDEGWHNKRRRYSDGPQERERERERGPRSPPQGSQPREGGHQGHPPRANPRSARGERQETGRQVAHQEDRPPKRRDQPAERERERERKQTDPKTQGGAGTGGPSEDKDKNKNAASGGGGAPVRSARPPPRRMSPPREADRGGPNAPQAKPRKSPLPDQGEEFNKSERHRGHSGKRRRTSDGPGSGRERGEGRHNAGNEGNRRPEEHERRRKKHRKH